MMAAARKHKRVAASQPGFLPLKSGNDGDLTRIGRRKRVNKNKKKNWNKYSDIHDVEEFLDDVRLQERATGGLIADKPDHSLFFVDKKCDTKPEVVTKKGRNSKPLRIDLILQPDSRVAPPKDIPSGNVKTTYWDLEGRRVDGSTGSEGCFAILAYQRPNAKKERRVAQKAEKLAAMGALPRREKLLRSREAAAKTQVKDKPVTNNDPARGFYDIWSTEAPETADLYYLEQTKKKLVKRPEKLNEKPSVLPAVEVIAPGGSYNPDFFSHQALLLEAHGVEVKKLKAEEKLERKLAVEKQHVATEESILEEQVEGLIEEDEAEEDGEAEDRADFGADAALGPAAQPEKKTERQRKREKAERMKELHRKAERKLIDGRQQLFQLRSIGAELKRREGTTKMRQIKRKEKQEAQKTQPRRLGRLKFQAPDLDVQLSDELPGSLRTLKPEGSVLTDRFKSLQKRNLIEPRERAKFKRKYKLKYVEKRAFREIK